MQPQKTIQPSDEIEQEAKNNLINVVRNPAQESEETQAVKIPSPDELDKADNATAQQANALIAEAEIKDLPDKDNSGDDPYIHNSTQGFGLLPWGEFNLLRNSKSKNILAVLLVILVAVVLIIKYASKL